MNATVIMVSQGAMALGGVIWGCAATKAAAIYALDGAAILVPDKSGSTRPTIDRLYGDARCRS